MPGRLKHDVGRSAEAEETERLAIVEIRQSQGPIADDAGAQQGSRLHIAERLGDRIGGFLRNDHGFGVAAVGVAAGPAELLAEVLVAGPAELADAAGRVDPPDPDTLARREPRRARSQRVHPPDDLVARNDGQLGFEPALDLIQFGMADAARRHADANFVGPRLGRRHVP